ncbi:MAG TPA: hypothetical protein VI248_18530 [Kineosporiaceae bacterium]
MPPPSVIREFARTYARVPEIQPEVVETLVEFKESYFGDPHPTRWQADVLNELLLDVLPRTVTAPDDWFAAVVPTTRAYLTFLHDGKRLAPGSDPAPTLLTELDRIGDQVLAAFRDPRDVGPAKAILTSVGLGPSQPGPAAVMEAFNALPFEHRSAILDPARGRAESDRWFDRAPDDEDDADDAWPDLPLTWLPAVSELAGAALSAPLAQKVLRLAAWVGSRRKTTRQEVLTLPDARRACADLGLPLPEARVRTADDIPALDRLWALAIDTGLLDAGPVQVVPGSAAADLLGPSPDPSAVVAWWADLLDNCLTWAQQPVSGDTAQADDELDDDLDDDLDDEELLEAELLDAVDAVVPATLVELYDGVAVPVGDLAEVVLTTVVETVNEGTGGVEVPAGPLLDQARRHWNRHLAQLTELGAVTVDDGALLLTPLGRAGIRTLALAEGADAPLADDPAALDAPTLLEALPRLGETVAEPLLAAWSAARTPQRATAELLAAARLGKAVHRVTAFAVLADQFAEYVGTAGRATMEALRDDPVLAVYAHVVLNDGAEPEPLPAALRQWAALEAVALALAADALADPETAAAVWEILDTEGDLDSAWRSTHPQLIEVLEGIAEHHPQGGTRKAAKKALFKTHKRAATPLP